MNKTPVKIRQKQRSQICLQIGPLCQSRMILKSQQTKLKKIGRNRYVFKQISLPAIAPTKNKEAQQFQNKQVKGKQNQIFEQPTKYLSLVKNRQTNIQQRLDRRAITQNLQSQKVENQKIKEMALKRHYLIRNKKLLPLRNCMSAMSVEAKKQLSSSKQHAFRKNLLKKKLAAVQDQKQKLLYMQANKIAKQARALSAPRLNRLNFNSNSLQDFLNDWKGKDQ